MSSTGPSLKERSQRLEAEEAEEVSARLAAVPPILISLSWCSAVQYAAWSAGSYCGLVAALYVSLVSAMYTTLRLLPLELFDKFAGSSTYLLSFLCCDALQALVIVICGADNIVLGNIAMMVAFSVSGALWHRGFTYLHDKHSGHEHFGEVMLNFHSGLIACSVAGSLEDAVGPALLGYQAWNSIEDSSEGSSKNALILLSVLLASVIAASLVLQAAVRQGFEADGMLTKVTMSTSGYFLGFWLDHTCMSLLAGPLQFLYNVPIGHQDSQVSLGILLYPCIMLVVGTLVIVCFRENQGSLDSVQGKVGLLMYQSCMASAFETLFDAWLESIMEDTNHSWAYFSKATGFTLAWALLCVLQYLRSRTKDVDEEKPIGPASKAARSYQKPAAGGD